MTQRRGSRDPSIFVRVSCLLVDLNVVHAAATWPVMVRELSLDGSFAPHEAPPKRCSKAETLCERIVELRDSLRLHEAGSVGRPTHAAAVISVGLLLLSK